MAALWVVAAWPGEATLAGGRWRWLGLVVGSVLWDGLGKGGSLVCYLVLAKPQCDVDLAARSAWRRSEMDGSSGRERERERRGESKTGRGELGRKGKNGEGGAVMFFIALGRENRGRRGRQPAVKLVAMWRWSGD